jgi:AcrR family transcriptional regulator
MRETATEAGGLRERKRRETRLRIAEMGLQLFIKNGYEATTLEEITAAAGISRRTFFYYFKSKDDILLASQGGGFEPALKPAMGEESPDQLPLLAVRSCLLKLASRLETQQSIVVDRLLQSTEALQARKRAAFVDMEQTLLEAMCQQWPQPGRRAALQIVAMVSMGALRLAIEHWRQEKANRPLAYHIGKAFDLLESEI